VVTLFAGKVETSTFHFLSTVLMLGSSNFFQKLCNLAVIIAYFAVFMFAVAAIPLCRAAYNRAQRHVFENCRHPSTALVFMSVDLGFFGILLGITHRLLLDMPLAQLYALITIEIIHLVMIASFLIGCHFQNNVLGVTLTAMHMSRFIFIVSILAYSLRSNLDN
jgi:hypothetical protein